MPSASTISPDPIDYESKPPNGEFDPDHFRMTIGEHLEELRSRLIKGLIGFAIALAICLVFAKGYVIPAFCKPLTDVLVAHDLNPQLVTDEVGEGFTVYLTMSLICATALASPWMLYQLWQFVAAGLYPKERKYVTRYMPLSIFLLVGGMVFVYMLVLPWTLDFFIEFSTSIKPTDSPPAVTSVETPNSPGAFVFPQYEGTPPNVYEGMPWIDTKERKLKILFQGQIRVLPFNSPDMLTPEIKLSTYIDMVIAMLLTFGLSFQLPLVVLALERIGILEIEALQKGRRYVYFVMVILAAVITPGDVITATIALMFPLIGLYELGILLARMGKKPNLVES